MALRHWMQLALTDGIGPVLLRRLVERAGSPADACAATATLLREVDGIGTHKAASIAGALHRAIDLADRELERAAALGLRVLCPEDQDYPSLLHDIPDAPAVLWMRGRLEPRDLNAVAIVGSRRCSLYGREQSERFASLLASTGITVVSGGARGIDSSAHRGALRVNGGRTVAVLGSGVDVPYPPENEQLFNDIASRGAVLSEFPPGTPPAAENFPRRNRIVSGMSRGVLVVEADERSGALITARQAIDDHNRPVFAIPGRVDNPLSNGPHRLIREGAILVTGLQDLLDGLEPLPQSVHDRPTCEGIAPDDPSSTLFDAPGVPEPEKRASTRQTRPTPVGDPSDAAILEAIGDEELTADAIVERSGLDAGAVMTRLTMLTLQGRVERRGGQRFARRRQSSYPAGLT